MEKNLKSHSDEIDIPEEEPFKNCALDRKKYAEILTDIVSVYSKSGCVLALNGEWGSGKTTFVKMWKQLLINKGFQTLYFNAWESDYTMDPLIAMLSEFESLSSKDGNYKKLISAGGRIALSVGVDIAKGIIKKTTGIDPNKIQATIKEASDIGTEYLKEYAEQKSSFKEFKESLKEFVGSNANDDKPIVFFVDELDRCNPTYAVKVLERIKHLFDIPQIVFVLAVNKKQLSNAIKGYFGSWQMDADAYLRRFIDIEYTLPEPDMEKYCSYLYKMYNFNDFFNRARRIYLSNVNEEEEFENIISTIITSNNHLSLRTVDKIFAHSRLALREFKSESYSFPNIFFLLCYWKITDPEFYNNIRIHKYNLQQLTEEIERRFPNDFRSVSQQDELNRKIYYLTFALGTFIYKYNINKDGHIYENIFISKNEQSREPTFSANCDIISKTIIDKSIAFCMEHSSYSNGLENIFSRIELLNNFVSF